MSGHAQSLAERRATHWGGGADMVHPPDSTGWSRLCGAGEEPAESTLPQSNLPVDFICKTAYSFIAADSSHFIVYSFPVSPLYIT